MFRAIRIFILLVVLAFVAIGTWLTQVRSTDWNNTLRVKVYPINADGSDSSTRYIERLKVEHFESIETFIAREAERYGRDVRRPVRVDLGLPLREQPPTVGDDPNVFSVMLWSLKMRWWASNVTDNQDTRIPDVRIFVRYHSPETSLLLEDSVGIRKGMFGIVNAYAARRHQGRNNVVIAHEFLHTLGASDKYDMATGQPLEMSGIAEPDKKPLYPQRFAEIMGGRIALAPDDAEVPKSLKYAVIGPETAAEIRLLDD